jgi:hypothetical protein
MTGITGRVNWTADRGLPITVDSILVRSARRGNNPFRDGLLLLCFSCGFEAAIQYDTPIPSERVLANPHNPQDSWPAGNCDDRWPMNNRVGNLILRST